MGYPDWQSYTALANLIAAALATAGIPVLGNPVPLYSVQATTGGGPGALVGAYVNGPAWTPPLTHAAAMAAFNTYVNGNPCNVASKSFIQKGQWPSAIPTFDQALINAGAVIYLSVKPDPAMTVAEQDNLAACLALYQAAGAHLRPILWSEPQLGFTDVNQWLTYWAYYQPVIKAAGLKCVYDAASSTGEANISAYWPTPTPDEVLQDLYWSSYSNGITLGTMLSLAAQYGIPAGIGEWNVDANNQKTPTAQQWGNFITYIIQSLTDQIQSGNAVNAVMFFMGNESKTFTNNQLLSANAMQVPGFNAIVAALSAPPASPGFTINPGATVIIPPLAGSPVANYAQANGQSYDLVLNLLAGAGSTEPFAGVTLNWLDADLRNLPAVHSQRWVLPAGKSTSAGTQIAGFGPQRAQYLQVKMTNHDTVAMTGQLNINSVSRVFGRDDIRWEAPLSVAIPGYTLAGGQGYGLMMGEISGQIINAGHTSSWLFSLFAGQAQARVVVNGAAGVRTVHVTFTPVPSDVWGIVSPFSVYLPLDASVGDNDQPFTIALPRGPCLLTVTNNDTAQITVACTITAIEPG